MVPQEIKQNYHMIQQFHFWVYPNELNAGSQRDNWTPKFTAVLFTRAETWRNPKSALMDKWISEMWNIHITGLLFILKKEILQYATPWRNLEHIMLNEISQSLKDKYNDFLYYLHDSTNMRYLE